ncbi:MAG: serine/threonine-protein kinase [Polyangiaceae bacterium]
MGEVTEPQNEVKVIGRYALHAQIARGGMATVHLGRLIGQAGFSRTVAIKRLHPYLAQDPEFVSMLIDEARLAARIRHPNVVVTLDVVALEGELLVVMEYVHGEALSRLLRAAVRKGEQVPPRIASAILSQGLYGLHAAHEATDERGEPLNIVHRDVSPQNLVVGSDGATRVVDFGVAKAAGRLQETREGQLKGKIRYMAPEQLRRGPVDRRADIYAAGVVAWECLTGRRLFDAENEWQIATTIMEGVNEPPSAYGREVSAELDAVILRALAVSPDERFGTAFEMAEALEDAVPPATPREVARWVQEIAKEALTTRAAKLKAIEGLSADLTLPVGEGSEPSYPFTPDSLSLSSKPALPRADEETGTRATEASVISMDEGLEATHAKRRRLQLIAGSVALAVLLLSLVVVLVGRGSADEGPSAADSRVPSPPPSAKPSASVVAEAVPPAPASAPAPPSAAPEPSAAVAPRADKTVPKPTGKGKLAPWPEKTQKPASCNPPFYYDAKGVKVLKPECF